MFFDLYFVRENGHWLRLWNNKLPSKVKDFIWRCMKNYVPTEMRLINKNCIVNDSCVRWLMMSIKWRIIFLLQWEAAQNVYNSGHVTTTSTDIVAVGWRCPVAGELKCNVDAVESSYISAIHEAWKWLRRHNIDDLINESDCQIMINALKENRNDLSDFGLLVQDCMFLQSSFTNLSFNWIKEKVNKVVYRLAKVALLQAPNYEFEELLEVLSPIIHADLFDYSNENEVYRNKRMG
ncbi:hypothetical protein Godav_001479 [Gossypium davidsonii]|uniref:RNase H type-1 domain-containing protein n=1 Tax=Gossypium davidsonii TaxID=34287 RepID=A0A7J8T378_GOSDV|nr:hypothetical protein [Gossypium davidsonii]